MKTNEFNDWVSSLKPGDRVAIRVWNAAKDRFCRGVVKALHKRHVVVSCSHIEGKFRRDTGGLAGDRSSWNLTHIERLTPELEETIRRNDLIRKLRSMDGEWPNLSTQTLLDLVARIREDGKP